MSLSPATRLAVEPHVRFRRFESEGVIIQQTNAEALVVNEVGSRLLEIADGTRTLREIVTLLAAEYDESDEAIERDLLGFAQELVDAGVVRVVET
ncbi:MAG TPA: PqqD family protein [Thermoanaerobaculia bacterium]